MPILPRERIVENFEQLEAYVDKHKGSVHGSIPIRRSDFTATLEMGIDGSFHKLPSADTETGGTIIEFQPYSNQNPDFSDPEIISENTFARSSLVKVSVLSRHKITPAES